MVSNVKFKSNLYPLRKNFETDYDFLSQIHDIFALEILKYRIKNRKFPNFAMSEIQKKEYDEASVHCVYAYEDDYPWGTIIDEDGKKRVVCKCLNIECQGFKGCRPNFDPKELDIIEENERAQRFMASINDAVNVKVIDYNPNETESNPIEESKVPPLELEVKFATPPEADLFESKTTEPETDGKSNESDRNLELTTNNNNNNNNIPKAVELTEKVDFNSFRDVKQQDIIKAAPEERIIVNAGPGTGKTWTLIEKLIYMVNEQNVDPEEILIFCFSRAAIEVIRSRIDNVSAHKCKGVDIRTFDSFATYMLAYAVKELPELLPKGYILEAQTYDERIRQATSLLRNKPDILSSYRHIIIDEVQDLVGARAELVIELLRTLHEECGFTLLGDSCQALYDYLACDNTSVMSSEKFYSELFERFPMAKYYSLIDNHRQTDTLKNLTNPYREKILIGTEDDRQSVLTNVRGLIDKIKISFSQFDAGSFVKNGSLGILTRTNGQAIYISSLLRNAEINHNLQDNARYSNFADWIAKIFCGYSDLTVNEADFIERHAQIYPEINEEIAVKRWQALIDTMNDSKKRYEVADILKNLIGNAKDSVLFENDGKLKTAITVSNIHRAKGKEFDSVLLLDDIFEVETDNSLEHKVCYVGITRAKSEIKRASIPPQYMYIIQNENRRCYKTIKSKKYLRQIEVGIEGDVDIKSFGADTAIQDFIRNNLKSGMELKLIKCPKDTERYIKYDIIIEEPQYLKLGCTGKLFAIELEMALKRIFKLSWNCDVYYEYFPNEFCNVYVDELITCISGASVDIPAAKVFDDMKIWSGFTITGLAEIDNNSY